MMNRFKGEVPLSLPDKRNFTLVIDHEALISAESLYGKPLEQMLADLAAGFVGAMRALLWAALQAKHRGKLTIADASAIIFEHGEVVAAALEEATKAAMPDPDPSAEGKAKDRQAGKTSGGNGAKRASTRKGSGKKPRAASR